jgi:hypothetical protein
MILGREPVAIAAVVAIAVNLLVSFGLQLTVDQIALINTLVVGVLALIARSGTTSLAAPVIPAGTTVSVVTPAGSPNGSTTLGVSDAGEVTTAKPA